MKDFFPIHQKPAVHTFKKGDLLVLFGELFNRGYANGLVEEAEKNGLTVIRATVGRRDAEGHLRPLTAEESANIPQPFINIPLEAGFDLEKDSHGKAPVDYLAGVKLSAWQEAAIPEESLNESRHKGRERFAANTKKFLEALSTHIKPGQHVHFAHLMAGGVPRCKIVMPLMNRVFKGLGDRFLDSILETISAQSPRRKETMNALKLLLAMTLALPSIAEARPEIVDLDLYEQEFNSRQGEDTVFLKALINRYYGGRIDLESYDLEAVLVAAKSRHGGGQISLLVGGRESAPQTIAGNPRDYDMRRVGYYRYDFLAPGRNARGVWQLKIQGNIKIDTIRVRMRLAGGGGGGGGHPGRYDSFRIGKIGSGNPFGGWDTDTVQSTLGGRFLGVELRLDQGIGLEVRDIEVVCRDGRTCASARVDAALEDRRPIRVFFRAPLDVKMVRVRSKSLGISIPSSKAEVFLLR